MWSRSQLYELLEARFAALQLPSHPVNLYDPIGYSLRAGGKRLRPMLTLLANKAFGGDPEQALSAALAIEVFHNFTLLHDDIMDRSVTRRGLPTVHIKWGENAAILSGDAMMIYAYTLLEGVGDKMVAALLPVFNRASLQVCEGQQLDMDFSVREHIKMEEYLVMIEAKTAALFAGAVVMGAICGGADERQRERIDEFGRHLGVAFQIQDDILDCYGTTERLGKRIGGDILEGKKSFLTVAAMERADETTGRRLNGLLHNREMIEEQRIAGVLAIYAGLGVRSVAEEAVAEYTRLALAALTRLELGERGEALVELAGELTERIK